MLARRSGTPAAPVTILDLLARARPLLLLPLIAAATAVQAAPASAAPSPVAQAAAPPSAMTLASGWRFRADPDDRGRARHFEMGRGGGWKPVSVPHVLDARPIKSLSRGTLGWYRLRFKAPSTRRFDWKLRFEQVRRTARVWLNGKRVGASSQPFIPFEVPASGLRPGRVNTLVVRVDSRKERYPAEGWWNWGGIVRPVELLPVGRIEVEDLGLMSRLDCTAGACTNARVVVAGTLHNRTRRSLDPKLDVSLRSPSGVRTEETLEAPKVGAGKRKAFSLSVPVEGPAEPWSPERPNLYRALVRTRAGKAIEQSDSKRIGLRSVEVRDGLLFLNGRRVSLRGASMHEDVPRRGAALRPSDIESFVTGLQEVGADITRTHYVLSERLLDRLDEEGIMVWSQAPVFQADRQLRKKSGRAFALRTLRGTVLAARSHPSVITHSVANELVAELDKRPGSRRYLQQAAPAVRRLDPTLPVAVDLRALPNLPREPTYDRYDLLGLNAYFGWYLGEGEQSIKDFEDFEPYLDDMNAKYPRAGLVLTEFGAEALFDGPVSQKGTYAFQTGYIRRVLDVIDRKPYLSGAIYWTIREFAVRPKWDGGVGRPDLTRGDAIHNKGLVFYKGGRKPAWQLVHDRFLAAPLYAAP